MVSSVRLQCNICIYNKSLKRVKLGFLYLSRFNQKGNIDYGKTENKEGLEVLKGIARFNLNKPYIDITFAESVQ